MITKMIGGERNKKRVKEREAIRGGTAIEKKESRRGRRLVERAGGRRKGKR